MELHLLESIGKDFLTRIVIKYDKNYVYYNISNKQRPDYTKEEDSKPWSEKWNESH